MKNRNGFTLVELLAVIVILAIILLIAVPTIMDTIENTRKGALESTAKLIAGTAEKKLLENQVLGIEEEIDCEDIAEYNDEDYVSCDITFDSGEALVTIVGSGKFEGMQVVNGTKTEASVSSVKLPEYGNGVAYIRTIYDNGALRLSNGLTNDDPDNNIRYSGGNDVVKNYVYFGNDGELWRIIGVFDGKIKIIREDSIGLYSWDSSASTVNDGGGVNQWGEIKDVDGNVVYEGADLMRELNTLYLNQNSGYCCKGVNQGTCDASNGVVCDFTETTTSVKGINNTYRNMIAEVEWNTGAINVLDLNLVDLSTMASYTANWYNAERGTYKGDGLCSEDEGCDTIGRTTTWTGKVALPYVTDYAYASSESACRINMNDGMDFANNDFTNMTCKKNNWMHYGSSIEAHVGQMTWFLTPFADTEGTGHVSTVLGSGRIATTLAYSTLRIRPTVYLDSNVQIVDGDGSIDTPYELSMGA